MTPTPRLTVSQFSTEYQLPTRLQGGSVWKRALLALLTALALVSTSIVSAAQAQTAQAAVERPSEPDFISIYAQMIGRFSSYKECTDEVTKKTIATMWERQVPMAASLYDIGHAYRSCEGFEDFWQSLYFAGFDTPEQWIDMHLRLIRLSGMLKAETDMEAMTKARDWLRTAMERTPRASRLSAEERRSAQRLLSEMMYNVVNMMPNEGDPALFAELIEKRPDDFFVFLPEESDLRLKETLEFAQSKRSTDEGARRAVQSQMRN